MCNCFARRASGFVIAFLAFFSIMLSACGGGGSNSGSNSVGGSSAGNSGGTPPPSSSNPGGSSGGSGSTGSGGGSSSPGGSGAQGGTYVYAILSSGGLGGYRLNSDGSLTALSGSPFSVAGSNIAASGTHLFAAGQNQLVVYGIDPQTGSLTAQSQAAVAGIRQVAAAGGFVYATGIPSSGGWGIFAFSVAQNGTLTPVPGSPFPDIAACEPCVSPTSMTAGSKYLVTGAGEGPHGAGGFALYPRQSNGAVQRTSAIGSSSVLWLALNQTETVLYAIQDGDNSILVSSIDANGQMTLLQDLLPPDPFNSAVPDPSGKYVVAAGATTLLSYVLTSDGKLTTEASRAAIPGGKAIFDPSGHFVVLANSSGLITFSFNASSGAFTKAGSTAVGTASPPLAVAF
ncbi:MAG TPA: hypothetical protein VG498_25300 [Terriglobales bacterium]|nr:hypothetical protein [Terriglobales bacterium]